MLTKKSVLKAWANRPAKGRVILRDGGGLLLDIRPNRADFRLEYRLAGTLEDGRRPPTRQLHLAELTDDFDLAEIRSRASAARLLVRQGRDPAAEARAERAANLRRVTSKRLTVGELLDSYAAARGAGWTQNTRRAYRRDFELIRGALGELAVEDVTRADLIGFLRTFHAAEAKQGQKGTRVERIAATLSGVFRHAADDLELLADNTGARLPRLARSDTRRRILSAEEIKALWRALDGTAISHRFGLAWRLSLVTGQRIGAVLSARVSELSFDGALVFDTKRPVWRVPFEEGRKSKRDHIYPLSDLAVELWREAIENFAQNDRIFAANNELGFSRQDSASEAFIRLRTAGGAPADVTGHDLRRTARTMWSRLTPRHRQPREVLERLLGHATGPDHYDHYHFLPEMAAVADAWSEWLGRVVGGEAAEVVDLRRGRAS